MILGTMPRMPNQKEGIRYIAKTLTIRSDQNEYLKKNAISLSRFVQQKLDEAMGLKRAEK